MPGCLLSDTAILVRIGSLGSYPAQNVRLADPSDPGPPVWADRMGPKVPSSYPIGMAILVRIRIR